MESLLPPGWHEAYDPTHHRKYYYNLVSNMTQWERPELSTAARWSYETDGAWCTFSAEDSALIESKYMHGPSGAFSTRFSFSPVPYHLDFALMIQINTDTDTRRRIRRDVGDSAGSPAEAGVQTEHRLQEKWRVRDHELAAALAQIVAPETLADVICPSVSPSVHKSVRPSVRPSVRKSVRPTVRP